MRYLLIFFLLFVLITTSIYAQKKALNNRFSAGVVIGVNTSQIDGDNYSGYNKFGSFAGFRAITRINQHTDLVVEMQYNRKGSRNPNQFVPPTNTRRFISLDYIEVPILYHKRIETTIGVSSLEAGIAYARLFGFKINEDVNSIKYISFTSIQETFNKNELVLLLGGGVFINEHIRVMGRFSYSLTLLYKNENPVHHLIGNIQGINHLRNIQLAFGANYIF